MVTAGGTMFYLYLREINQSAVLFLLALYTIEEVCMPNFVEGVCSTTYINIKSSYVHT